MNYEVEYGWIKQRQANGRVKADLVLVNGM